MANITRIKAGEASAKKEPLDPPKPKKAKDEPKKAPETPKADKNPEKSQEKSKKSTKKAQKDKKPFILFRPFIALGHYLRDSWREIRQVRWPSRKATWKMFLAVLIYAALFIVLITLLDIFFEWLFSLILGTN